MATPTKRVLALHGYSQNASTFSKRIGALRKECRDIEFVFINAPHILLPADLEAPSEELVELQSNPDTAMRGWWTANKERTKVTGLQESLMVIKDVLKNHRFDGIFGFSQGAAFAALISSLLERPNIYSPFLDNDEPEPPHPKLQFCVAVSGFRVLDPFCDPFYSPRYITPTLHVIGRTDVVVVEERSRQLIEVSETKRVEEHEGGHYVPAKVTWRKFLAAYMRDPLAPHASPSSVSDSGPSSGPSQSAMDYRKAVLMRM